MGQKATKNEENLTKTQKRRATVKRRQLQLLHGQVLGQSVHKIAEQTGWSESILWKDVKDLRKYGVTRDLIEQERQVHIKALPLATSVLIAHLLIGDKEVAMGMQKGLRVWSDKLDIVAKVAPDDQQKKMMENMEALLKLSKGKVQGALSEPKEKKGECNFIRGLPPEKTEAMEMTKEVESQSQLKTCTCDPGWVDDIRKPVSNIDPKCSVHGDRGECSCPNQEVTDKADYTIDAKCPVHGDKDKEQGGGHPPPGGSDV